jgi:L-ascorbate metabolism protein UlaG (beta-lactamase superfamily)
MHRFAPLVVLFLAAGPIPANDKPVLLRWHGQSFFEIISPAGTRIAIDPHAIEAYGRKEIQADLVLMSHLHSDHTQVGVITNAGKARILPGLKEIKTEAGRREEWNSIDETFRDVKIRGVPTYHDAHGGLERGKNTVFVLEIAGLRIVHLGDLGHALTETQLKRIGEVDVLLVPIGGVYTLNGLDATAVVEQLKPKRVIIPMHYGTPVYDYVVDLDKSGFLDDVNPRSISRLDTNELRVNPRAKPPETPLYVIPTWQKKGEK